MLCLRSSQEHVLSNSFFYYQEKHAALGRLLKKRCSEINQKILALPNFNLTTTTQINWDIFLSCGLRIFNYTLMWAQNRCSGADLNTGVPPQTICVAGFSCGYACRVACRGSTSDTKSETIITQPDDHQTSSLSVLWYIPSPHTTFKLLRANKTTQCGRSHPSSQV